MREIGSEEQLALVVSLLSRKIQCPATAFGQSHGRCVPASLLLQLDEAGRRVTRTPGVGGVEEMRLDVLRWAQRNKDAPWSSTDLGQDKLGKMLAAATCGDYFHRDLQGKSWERDLRSWQHDHLSYPEQGCDEAWMFAAAARYGLRLHIYMCPLISLKRYTFAAPRSAWGKTIPKPTTDVHIGIVEGRDGGQHCVSLQRCSTAEQLTQLTPALALGAALLAANTGSTFV